MKQILLFLLASVLVLSLAACGGAVVDYDTPKSGELSAAYDFYRDSQASLASGMAITPEQADDAFIVLVSCGMDSKVSNVTRKQGDDGHCTVTSGFSTFDVYYTDGVIDRVEKSGETLYPAPVVPADDNPLTACPLIVADVKSGSGEKIGEYAYIEITKGQLEAVTAEEYKDFAETVVKDSGYNWVAIVCDDGTGICFPGSMYYVAQYGKQDTDGGILEVVGTITLDESGGYTYEPGE